MKVVFVGGIHGVGKSTLCERVAAANDFVHVTASAIIRDAGLKTRLPKEKMVRDVVANQALLLGGFLKLRSTCTSKGILLDGHFALTTHEGVSERVPIDVFGALQVSSLICLQDSPGAIASRLNMRDGSTGGEDFLSEFQRLELNHAAEVSRELGLRLTIIQAFDIDAMEAAMRLS
jgi:adenylate kinase